MVLKPKVSANITATRLALIDVDELSVENDRDLVANGDDFVGIPFTNLHVRMNARLDVVNRSGLVFMGLVTADLDLVALFDRNPWIVTRIRKTKKNPRVIGILGRHKFDRETSVGKLLFAIPPEAHASFCRGNTIF